MIQILVFKENVYQIYQSNLPIKGEKITFNPALLSSLCLTWGKKVKLNQKELSPIYEKFLNKPLSLFKIFSALKEEFKFLPEEDLLSFMFEPTKAVISENPYQDREGISEYACTNIRALFDAQYPLLCALDTEVRKVKEPYKSPSQEAFSFLEKAYCLLLDDYVKSIYDTVNELGFFINTHPKAKELSKLSQLFGGSRFTHDIFLDYQSLYAGNLMKVHDSIFEASPESGEALLKQIKNLKGKALITTTSVDLKWYSYCIEFKKILVQSLDYLEAKTNLNSIYEAGLSLNVVVQKTKEDCRVAILFV